MAWRKWINMQIYCERCGFIIQWFFIRFAHTSGQNTKQWKSINFNGYRSSVRTAVTLERDIGYCRFSCEKSTSPRVRRVRIELIFTSRSVVPSIIRRIRSSLGVRSQRPESKLSENPTYTLVVRVLESSQSIVWNGQIVTSRTGISGRGHTLPE